MTDGKCKHDRGSKDSVLVCFECEAADEAAREAEADKLRAERDEARLSEKAMQDFNRGLLEIAQKERDAALSQVAALREALGQTEHSLAALEPTWTKPAADRGAYLPSIRAALARARAALASTADAAAQWEQRVREDERVKAVADVKAWSQHPDHRAARDAEVRAKARKDLAGEVATTLVVAGCGQDVIKAVWKLATAPAAMPEGHTLIAPMPSGAPALGCEHGRLAGQPCPHCMGTNAPATKPPCATCGGYPGHRHLVNDEECPDCGGRP